MIKFWKKCLPLTAGLILSVAFIIFLSQFVRNIDYYDLSYFSESIPDLVAALVCGFLGIPLTISGIEKLSKKDL